MANTGNVFAGAGANENISAEDWLTPGNITADDGADATCNALTAAGSDFLVASNFGFAIPGGATINGITVRLEASEHSGGTEPLNVSLRGPTGAAIGVQKTTTISGTTKAVYTYGSTSDLWSATVTDADLNDTDFGVKIYFQSAHDLRIDFVTMAVEYTPASGAASGTATLTLTAIATGTLTAPPEVIVVMAPHRPQGYWRP